MNFRLVATLCGLRIGIDSNPLHDLNHFLSKPRLPERWNIHGGIQDSLEIPCLKVLQRDMPQLRHARPTRRLDQYNLMIPWVDLPQVTC